MPKEFLGPLLTSPPGPAIQSYSHRSREHHGARILEDRASARGHGALVPEPYAETTCLFTSTPSENFLVDGVDGITLVSPCSGHGAKFAPLIGDLAADVATGGGRAPDRFTVRIMEAADRG